ncbi:coiled-coil domain-containing protein [Paraburkholderia caballeronis]|uniref:Chromosome segregation ATPase n=1 Tax=Paraburkholderia caballeronis TaxID=416943 RepID=A0A1H7IT64_9BURK|nr:hypothetical protein [Paraburkholderia caballeronis]PXW27702.1 hypothetical protein C7403_103616 [Paraburkholderia caballeronis]PXX03176.1 hypothetical protein C7407_103616 [Paraburkholderia caballeronis]RAK03901.1 hypothetical protein C7409_103616 [Paraburkholderia caballeronis]SEC12790.1 hypothetical protein SAMN05445871_1697 [Paraburkholderia caballeronis]SEK65659.1 hypothetical protein SAMN05192542_1032 [Paraburkholderia caballeronis]
MQKISRIHLGNCGYRTAWYEGTTFELTDPDSGQPTDTLINLENGGGKTTLIGLVFSCFETAQERFLKHIQSKHNTFSQYFTHDGTPGFIIVEWLMPSRTAGGNPYRLVTGQAVAVRSHTEPPEVDRMFFSFEEHADLGLIDIPAPGLAQPTPSSMQEFSRWLHTQQKNYPGDVFISHNRQAEWQRHLRDERLIDLDMLRMQVNFSAQEGGFDTGFLDFKTEGEFLRKFLYLTSDTTKADEARKLVVAVCEKHRRKPQFQRRRDELTQFRASLNAFAEAAQLYLETLAAQRSMLIRGAQMVQALQARAVSLHLDHDREAEFEQTQRQLASAALADSAFHTKEQATVTWAWHQKRSAQAKARKEAADGRVRDLERDERLIRAARLQKEIVGIDEELKELDALAEAERANLKPTKDHVEIQGALLRRALFNEEQRLKAVLQMLDERATAREEARTTLRKQRMQAESDELRQVGERSKLQAAEDSYARRRQALEVDGTFLGPDETTAEALERLNSEAATAASERDLHRASQQRCAKEAREHRQITAAENIRAAKLVGEARTLGEFIARGEAELERLAQLPALLNAAESDRVDPLSAALPTRLREIVAESARQMSLGDVRLAELRATKQAIDETGVAGYSIDVAFVVETLLQAGVRSAKAYNEYISRALPDTAKARALVVSDPARFLGVSVASTELDKARAVAWEARRPARPVVVSVATLEPAAQPSERLVVPAEDDSAFNVEAAAKLGSNLELRVADENERRAAYRQRHDQTLKAIHELDTYAKEFGDGKLGQARAEKVTLEEDAAAATARAESLESLALGLDEKAQELELQAQTADARRQAALLSSAAVLTFQNEHEVGHAERVHRLEEIAQGIIAAQESKSAADEGLERLQGEHDRDHGLRVSTDHELKVAGEERAGVAHYDKDYPAHEQLLQNPRPVETLRRIYSDAEAAYLAEERDRLGVLAHKLEDARKRRENKAKEFTREFKGVQMADLVPFLNMNHEEALANVETALEEAKPAQVNSASNLQVVNGESKKWFDSNKTDLGPAVPAHEALNLDALSALMAEAENRVNAALERMRVANDAANQAVDRANRKRAAAEADGKIEALLRSSMGFEDRPDPMLIAAEIGAQVGMTLDVPDPDSLVLEADASNQVNALLKDYTGKNQGVSNLQTKARATFDLVKAAASEQSFREVDPDVAQQMVANEFGAACTDAKRLLEHLDDRIATTEATLQSMQADFDACVEEVLAVVRSAITTLNRATSKDKSVPVGAPYVGGKQVLKMRANFGTVPVETRRQTLSAYLDTLVDTNVFPPRGTDLIADAVARVYGRPLGLQVLKMSIEETEQYVPVERVSNSGGEGVVMAMFLYLVINQLRAENHAQVHRIAGGPLILDNPFAKATSPAMWRAQRLLAEAMDVQLIFATALQDFNALGEFQRFIRLRRAGQNSKTRRWHLEFANLKLNDVPEEFTA